MQAPVALLGAAAALGVWGGGAERGWLVGGVLLGSVVPFTFLGIMPTNRALLALSPEQEPPRAAAPSVNVGGTPPP